MKIIHVLETLPEPFPGSNIIPGSIYMGGPIPRQAGQKRWQPEAWGLAVSKGFTGDIFTPEPKTGGWNPKHKFNYYRWRTQAMTFASCVMFWVPSDKDKLPATNTRAEFMAMCINRPQNIILGIPDDAWRGDYFRHLAEEYHLFSSNSLEKTVEMAVGMAMLRSEQYEGIYSTPPPASNSDFSDGQ